MPSPFHEIVCDICGKTSLTRSKTTKTCSRKCGAILRERIHPSPGKPKREYSPVDIEHIKSLYYYGMTVSEIQAIIPGIKVQLVIARAGIKTRPAVKREQRGQRNDSWVDDPCYSAVHLRLGKAARFKCADCCSTAYDWSYEYGCPDERHDSKRPSPYCVHPYHYKPRCRKCHKAYDNANRR